MVSSFAVKDEKDLLLDAVQLWRFELILDLSFWDNVLAVLPALTSHY